MRNIIDLLKFGSELAPYVVAIATGIYNLILKSKHKKEILRTSSEAFEKGRQDTLSKLREKGIQVWHEGDEDKE